MTPTETAWLAGLVDGEGCIYIARRKPYASLRSYRYVLGLKIAMCHKPTIDRVAELTGIGSKHKAQNPGGPRSSTAYTWLATADNAARVITEIQPYLITKSEEAKVAIEFHSLPRVKLGAGNSPSPELIAQRFELWDRMRRLKSSFKFKEQHKEVIYG